jgi:hypothetical protein
MYIKTIDTFVHLLLHNIFIYNIFVFGLLIEVYTSSGKYYLNFVINITIGVIAII